MQGTRTPLSAAGAAVASVMAMLGCCLPLPAVLGAAGLGAAAGWLVPLRPYLLAGALACLAFAFYRLYHRRYCEMPRPWWAQLAVWLALAAVVVTWVWPERVANRLAGAPAPAQTAVRGKAAPLREFRHLEPLRESFNAAAGSTRVVALFSPT